jgi:hypothetical protein
MSLHAWAFIAMLSVTMIVIGLYALTPSLRWEGGRIRMSGYVRRHFFSLAALYLLLLAWGFRLGAYGLLLEGRGEAGAFVALDHRVGIPVSLILGLATAVGAMTFAWAGWLGQLRLALFTLAAVLLLSLGLRQLAPPIASRLLTPTDREARDRPYFATRAAFTRRAFDISRVRAPEPSETPNPRIAEAMRGVPMWDPETLSRAIGSTREAGRPAGVLGWEIGDNRLSAFVVERPVGPEAADPIAPWAATHVFADVAAENGAIVMDDEANETSARLAGALVGDEASGYAVVVDSLGVIAAPALATWPVRVAHAWALQNPRMLQTTSNPRQTRAVLIRNVRSRVRKLYPGFVADARATPLVVGDTIWWAVHLYSSSQSYPLSETAVTPTGDTRYFRAAAVAIVNSHSGRAFAIVDPEPDPVAQSWIQRFPRLFVTTESVSSDLLRQIPPPTDAARLQARVLAAYGRRGELAPASHLIRQHGGDTLFAFPAYTPFADLSSQRLGLALPIVDASERLRGAFLATGGAAYQPMFLELDSLGPRWGGVIERFRRALDSATAGIPRASDVVAIRGPVRAIPMGRTLGFVQTAYQKRTGRPYEVIAVAVLHGDSLGVGRSVLAAAGLPAPVVPAGALTPEAFRARVAAIYAQMREALTTGDLVAFAGAYENLGRALRANQTPP